MTAPKENPELPPCDMCKLRVPTSLEPSRSQLIFGGFRVRYERRCRCCERKVLRQLQRLLTPGRKRETA